MYEFSVAGGVVGGNVYRASPFPGAEPVLRGVRSVRGGGAAADYYGFLGCQVDAEALRNGTLAVVHARGIFPDGLLFKMPEEDALPPARISDLFPTDRDKLTIYLSVPARKLNGANCDLSDGAAAGARFTAHTSTVRDDVNGVDEKPLRLGKKNITLALETDVNPLAVTLPVARLMRSGAGRFQLDPDFIPPSLEMSASPRLMSLTQRLIEILEDKSDTLARSRASGSGKSGYASGEIASFWFLHAVNSGMAPLRHLFYSTHGHPEELYLELARLAGALCTFTLETIRGRFPRMIIYSRIAASMCSTS